MDGDANAGAQSSKIVPIGKCRRFIWGGISIVRIDVSVDVFSVAGRSSSLSCRPIREDRGLRIRWGNG
jgi:hypothetical protein